MGARRVPHLVHLCAPHAEAMTWFQQGASPGPCVRVCLPPPSLEPALRVFGNTTSARLFGFRDRHWLARLPSPSHSATRTRGRPSCAACAVLRGSSRSAQSAHCGDGTVLIPRDASSGVAGHCSIQWCSRLLAHHLSLSVGRCISRNGVLPGRGAFGASPSLSCRG